MKRVIISLLLLLLTGCSKYGLIEAKFRLSEKSRLPKWFNNNINYKHEVYITIYTGLSGNKAEVCLINLETNKVVKCIAGTYDWSETTKKEFEKKGTYFVYPNYSVVTADGISELFEQKEQGDVLYLTDKISPKLPPHSAF